MLCYKENTHKELLRVSSQREKHFLSFFAKIFSIKGKNTSSEGYIYLAYSLFEKDLLR